MHVHGKISQQMVLSVPFAITRWNRGICFNIKHFLSAMLLQHCYSPPIDVSARNRPRGNRLKRQKMGRIVTYNVRGILVAWRRLSAACKELEIKLPVFECWLLEPVWIGFGQKLKQIKPINYIDTYETFYSPREFPGFTTVLPLTLWCKQ